jgi:hypothetical protein
MYHPKFTQEGSMITIEPQDLLQMFEKAQLSDPQPSMRGTWPRSHVRGSGLFSSFGGTPLLMNESKDAPGKKHWNNLKSSAQKTVSKVGQTVKNKITRKNPKYDALLESDSSESHVTDESIASDRSDEEISDNITDDNEMLSKQIQKPTHSGNIIKPKTTKNTLLSCSKCEKQFTVKGNLTRHMSSVHESNKWECSKCSKSFSRSDKLKIHIRSCNQ